MGVRATVSSTGLPLDDRGLIELDQARKEVARARQFRKGKARRVAGSYALESDFLWACLMSLEDASEFVREATRIDWYFHPREAQNLEPIERYGSEIWPWLASFLHHGVLVNVPWCVVPCLNALGTREAWDLLYSAQHIVQDERAGVGPFAADSPGDVDAAGLDLAPPAPSERSSEATRALLDFAEAHAEIALPDLVDRALAADAEAKDLLQMAASSLGPSATFEAVAEVLGEGLAGQHFDRLGLPRALTAEMIINTLDYSAESGDGSWPVFFQSAAEYAYHALRLVAFREREGDGWALVFERLEGSSADDLAVRRYATSLAFGCGVLPSHEAPELFLEHDEWSDEAENTLVGPAGDVVVTRASLDRLEPERASASDVDEMSFTLFVRACLADDASAFWGDADDLTHVLGLEAYELVLVSDAFEHVVTPDSAAEDPAGIDERWRRLPSQSPVYQSLARALVSRDPALFEPGQSNLDWRLHLDRANPERTF